MNKSICEDVNECRTGTHLCDKNAICDNSVGSYICDCKEDGNWHGDGLDCYYHDPCWNRSGLNGLLSGPLPVYSGNSDLRFPFI